MKALVIRYGAYGDIIHMSWIPKALKEDGFSQVDVETNYKGYQLLTRNPHIDNIEMFEPSQAFKDAPLELLFNKWDLTGLNYDCVINLYHSLECGALAMEDQSLYYMHSSARRKHGKGNYYDITAMKAGLPHWVGRARGDIYYNDKEHAMAREWAGRYEGKFIVVLNLNGTGKHKVLKYAQDLSDMILSEFSDAVVITTGDKKAVDIYHSERTATWVGKIPFREALLRIKYAHCVVGCESGLMCGAGMWGTPAVQIMTAASIENHCKYSVNDFSIQSPAYCSPCHRGPYKYIGCPFKDGLPLCVDVKADMIMENVRKIYETRNSSAATD